AREIEMRKNEIQDEIETIYFGGGTPSVLSNEEINLLIETVYKNYTVIEKPEITLEANPDDLSKERIKELANSKINRLSIGIQSFFEEDLKMMNRAHNAAQAKSCLEEAVKHFNNITIDLIYGMHNMSDEKWTQNIDMALSFGIPSITSFALTVEPRTSLKNLIDNREIAKPNGGVSGQHYFTMFEKPKENGLFYD